MIKTLSKPWPWNTIPEPTPADWGIGMTVCIASHCFGAKAIVLASDTMVSTHDMSADLAAFKFQSISRSWIAQYAGNDVGQVTPLLHRIRGRLDRQPDTLENVVAAFTDAFTQELRHKTEIEIVRPLGYASIEEFRSAGARELGSDMFTRALIEMQQQIIDVQFLVAGFDENKEPQIFTVTSPGKVSHFIEVGFWAIGSGQTNALGSLFNLKMRAKFGDLATNMYRVCEAKFNAENALGVGRETSLLVLHQDTTRYHIDFSRINELRAFWESTRTVAPPAGASTKADELIKEAREKATTIPGQQLALAPSPTTQPTAQKSSGQQ
jgi:ATP-dependent protease HslVU (ClpYQ) peptidase subunit